MTEQSADDASLATDRFGDSSDQVPVHHRHAAIPAASALILRDVVGGPPELLMVRRSHTMAFAAGAVVFPGGRVDDDDRYLATRFEPHLDRHEGAARVAAIRETLEETGLPIGLVGALSDVATARQRLLDGDPFSSILDENGWEIDPDVLVPFARWLPDHAPARVFDTRFYVVRAPDEHHELSVINDENTHVFWGTAQSTLDAFGRAELELIFPTQRNLERIALASSHDMAVAHANAHPVQTITPWVESRDGEACLCIPDCLGYPITSEPVAQLRRG